MTSKWPGRVLSPVIDADEDTHSSWAVTQQHGKTVNKPGSRKKLDTKVSKLKRDPKSKTTIPVLGSLTMKIETHNPFDCDKKEHLDILYRNKLLRNKRQKSIQGMFQAAKANKELSQALLNMNPSFNLDIGEHDLNKFLAPNRHIPPPSQTVVEDIGLQETEEIDGTIEEASEGEESLSTPLSPALLTPHSPLTSTEVPSVPHLPPLPLTANDLIRRSKVIDAVAPSSFWKPMQSVSQ